MQCDGHTQNMIRTMQNMSPIAIQQDSKIVKNRVCKKLKRILNECTLYGVNEDDIKYSIPANAGPINLNS
jgi:hypothetical protein